MKNYIITFLMVLASNSGHAAVISGSASEWKTQNPTHGQEHFMYQPGMKTLKLKNKVDLGERIFLSIPASTTSCGTGRWVYGKDYQYNTDTNSIEFLRDDISPYDIGGARNEKCKIGPNTIIHAFYRKDGEIKALRDKYGSNVSVGTLDYLNSSSVESLKPKCFVGEGGRLEVELFQSGKRTSTSFFYGKDDIAAITKFTCNGQVESPATQREGRPAQGVQ